jgi:hypothetical protein
LTLRTLPTALRALFSCFLITIGMGYLAAIYYLFVVDVDPHQKMAMSPVEAIAAKYHGDRGNTRLESALNGSMSPRVGAAERTQIVGWLREGATQDGYADVKPILDKLCVACHSPTSGLPVPPLTTFDEVTKVAQVDTGESIAQLARVSHVHLFGISIIFLLTGAIFALSELSSLWRTTIITLPFLTIWTDIGAWWITKYAPVFAWVVIIGGALMGLALGVQIFISLWEMWFARHEGPRATGVAQPRGAGKP